METKTDNAFLGDKVALRASCSPWTKKPLRVLDVFGGKGLVWASVARLTKKPIDRLSIDKRLDLMDFHLHGDNIKVLEGIDVHDFNVIDLDAYGFPCDHIISLHQKKYCGVIFATMIQTHMGSLPKAILAATGFPDAITKKSPDTCKPSGLGVNQGVAGVAGRPSDYS